MAPIKGKYLVDSKGHPTAVMIGIKDYKKMMKLIQDMRDVKFIHSRRNEKLISMHEVHRSLQK